METNTASTATATKTDTLIIDDVDLELLEKQRYALILMDFSRVEFHFGREAMDALSGVLEMLDAWADQRDGYA